MPPFRPFLIALAMALTAPAVQAAPFAYVTNFGSNTISVIDTASNIVTATVAAGGSPNGVAVSPDGTRVYVTNQAAGTVSVIDTASNSAIATVAVGAFPIRVAVHPAGTRVYVTNENAGTVSVIDTASNTVTATVSVGGDAYGVAINPAGTRLYVGSIGDNRVSVIDTASNTVIATVAGVQGAGAAPRELAVNPAGSRVYVTDFGNNLVWVIDTACNTATFIETPLSFGVAVNPAGSRVYLTNFLSNTVSVLDTAGKTITATVPVGTNPASVAFNPAGTLAYVVNLGSNDVSVINTGNATVIATVAVGRSPLSVSIASGLGFVPPPPAPVGPHIQMTGMEVTQAIQDLTNSVPLVSGRRTFVRVYVQSDGVEIPGVTATLSGAGAICTVSGCVTGIALGSLVPSNAVGARITVRPMPKRTNVDDSFLFELPWNWTNYVSVRLHVELTADPGPPREACPATDSDPLIGFDYNRTTLRILFVRLGYRLPGTFPDPNDALAQASSYEQEQSESWIRRTYPLSELLTTPDANLFDAGLGSYVDRSAKECQDLKADEQSLCAHHYITRRLGQMQAVSGRLFGLRLGPAGSALFGDADGAYALIPQHPAGQFTRGACCTNRIGAGPSKNATYASYAAHEIGHLLGRLHPVQGSGDFCGHSADDPNYPYFLSFIAPPLSDPATDLLGFDGGDAGLFIAKSTLSPLNDFDVMGYCKPNWMSDYTYKNLYICLSALNSDLPGVTPGCGAAGDTRPGADAPQLGDWLLVFGNITPDLATANFSTQRVDRIVSMPLRKPGSHSIRLLGTGGVTLADYPFTPEVVEEGATTAAAGSPALSFGHVVPFVAGTQMIQIVDASAGSTVIGTKTVSANPPTISNVALEGAPNPTTGAVTVVWTATDPDGDNLKFDVFFTPDGGASLQPLMLGLSGRSVQIDTRPLSGGPAQFRVVATDGVHSAFADTPSFTLPNKPPQPRVLTPGDGTTIHVGQLVNLEGQATDPQDGVIPDTGLAWSTAGGPLGSGARLSITNLPVGVNFVTLTATNSLGLAAATTVSVIVEDNVDVPGPTLTAGPARIGWQVGVGESRFQTAALDIGNSGSGNLEFTASSSAPWLTLSTATGTAPVTLTLMADPIGFADGVTKEASIVLTAVGTPDQAITIPVTLSIGNTFAVGNTPACATNVSAQASVARGGFRRNSATGRYVQQVTLTNTGTGPISGSVSLVVDNLSSNATLFNKSGDSGCATPVGPYVNVAVGPDNVLSPGESATVVLEFTNPSNQSIAYSTRVLAGTSR
jgi:YVTN family beta-propeller protein